MAEFIIRSRYWIFGIVVLSTAAPASLLNAAEPSENAALQYWVAFAQLPDFSGADLSRLYNATTDHPTEGFAVPVGPELERFFQGSSEEALQRLRCASELPYCLWGTDFHRDGLASAPYAEKAHRLARVSLLRARWRFEHALWQQGIDDVIATMVMARSIGRDKISHAIHIGVMIETMCVVTTAVYLPKMPDTSRAILAESIAELPPFTSMSEVMRHSENLIDWFTGYVQQAEHDDNLRERIEAISSPEIAGKVLEQAPDAASLAVAAADARKLLTEGADLLVLPVPEFRTEFANRNIGQRMKENPVTLLLIPSLDSECNEQAVGRVRLALLRAGIEVLNRGPSALNDDSFSGEFGPFQYAAFTGGFELRSTLAVPESSPNCQALDFGLHENGPRLTRPCH